MILPEISFGALVVVSVLSGMLLLAGLAEVLRSPARRKNAAALGRMRALSGTATASAPSENIVRRKAANGGSRALPFIGDPGLALRRAGLTISTRSYLSACAAAAAVIGLFASLLISPVTGPFIGLAIGFLVPSSVLKAKHRRRVEAFVTQLPDALDLMMRGLRVGHPISVTITNVARTMPDPIGAEFGIVADQISHGDYLTDAFADLAARLDQEDMDYLSVSLNIQNGTGGNLADMLATLSKVIRDRIMMRRRVKAISSEGRLSALILSALPVLIFVATSITSPDYYGGVSDDPMYTPIGLIIIALVVANFLALRKLASFQI